MAVLGMITTKLTIDSTSLPATKTDETNSKSATASKTQTTNIDPRLPQGGVNMITPSALATSTFYKIGGDPLSFAWNYTSLSVTPSAIDVLVTCTANQATYTVASNVSFASTGSAVWDTKPEQTGTAPLLSETYTLIIHDAAKAVTDVAKAGYLGSYNQFSFGMYVPQKYVSLAGKSCERAGWGRLRHRWLAMYLV